MIYLKSSDEIELMAEAGRVCGSILYEIGDLIQPGISTLDIDMYVADAFREAGMTAAFLGYRGFPASTCVSVNEEVVHGIPEADRKLAEGDIVGIDIAAIWKGYVGDAARTYTVGEVSDTARHLIDTCKQSFFDGLKMCREGGRLTDIGNAIQKRTESQGFSVVRDYVGHGIGKDMHEDPQIRNYGDPGRGPKLMKGMALAIEPMINEGTYKTEVQDNDWTVVTRDGKLSAHYENTVVITEGEPLVLTIDEREQV